VARGYVYKRCKAHGTTGTPARGKRPPVPACRCKSGTWTWRAAGAVNHATGRRTQPSKGGFPDKESAAAALTDYLAETDGGRRTYDRKMTVGTWMRRWLVECERRVAAGTMEQRTLNGYRGHIDEHLAPLLGGNRLRDLTREHVDAALAQLAKPVETSTTTGRGRRFTGTRTASTINSIRRTLRTCLAAAERAGRIDRNPASGKLEAIGRIGNAESPWWEPGELQAFLDHVADDELVTMWTVAAFTGLRRSELCGLAWQALDLTGPVPGLHVLQRVSAANGPHPCPRCPGAHTGRLIRPLAKSKAGVRWVPLAKPALAALERRKVALEAWKETAGEVYVDHGLVWSTQRGEPLQPNDVTKRHGELVATAGLPPITLHNMRHGAGSLMVAAGMPIELVAKVLGHASPSVTRGIYLHGLKGVLAAGVDAAADLVRAPTPAVPHAAMEATQERYTQGSGGLPPEAKPT
jgi:integrase